MGDIPEFIEREPREVFERELEEFRERVERERLSREASEKFESVKTEHKRSDVIEKTIRKHGFYSVAERLNWARNDHCLSRLEEINTDYLPVCKLKEYRNFQDN